MNVVMNIDEYKKYKQGELNLLKIKMNNLGINKDKSMEWVKNNKNILLNIVFLTLFILPTQDIMDSIYSNISKLIDEAYKTQNPKEYIEMFFKSGWIQMFNSL